MSDQKPFIIQHPDGRAFELADYAFFLEEYEPQGFTIQNPPRFGYWGGPSDAPVAAVEVQETPEVVTTVETDATPPEPAQRSGRAKPQPDTSEAAE